MKNSLFYLCVLLLVLSCDKSINGIVKYKTVASDTVYFSSGDIEAFYYEKPMIASVSKSREFSFPNTFSYPQLYYLNFASERDSIVMRSGLYFFDRTASSIILNDYGECSILDSKTNQEFKNKFAPFILRPENYNCKTNSIQVYAYTQEALFESKLLDYVKQNPKSFVALWFLIQQFNLNGHRTIYDEILETFSEDFKTHILWKKAYQGFNGSRIKENKEFPVLQLKNTDLINEFVQLKDVKAKYILIYYWFSNCKPCIKSFPLLKKIYSNYDTLGFEIIGIATDNTKYADNWKYAINQYDLSWTQYLDENAVEASKDKIFTFPTTYLLDESGKVIGKNLGLDELEEFLRTNL